MQGIKQIVFGFIAGAIVMGSLAGFLYFTKGSTEVQLTEAQQWTAEHPKEVEWTIQRYNTFQKAANDAFFENDVASVELSK